MAEALKFFLKIWLHSLLHTPHLPPPTLNDLCYLTYHISTRERRSGVRAIASFFSFFPFFGQVKTKHLGMNSFRNHAGSTNYIDFKEPSRQRYLLMG